MEIHGASSDMKTTDEVSDAPPDTKWQNAKVVEIIQRTPRIKSFFLALSKPFDFLAGQHVDLRLTAADGYRAMRSYSIAPAPGERRTIELAIDLLDNGEVSPFFHEVVAIGDEIELRGPLGGYFVWAPSDGGPLLMVGGGSGLVPLMSMVRDRHASKSVEINRHNARFGRCRPASRRRPHHRHPHLRTRSSRR
jgi:ferredoxin-NADP reductase